MGTCVPGVLCACVLGVCVCLVCVCVCERSWYVCMCLDVLVNICLFVGIYVCLNLCVCAFCHMLQMLPVFSVSTRCDCHETFVVLVL